ncbi:TetR/AcrR family transcriptional regulator [Sphaerisporangium corydalis]|uniref:TetR/AcrR family transcriptional regulator n=1 Tax=Sphaerisporangium corydalis TaxID=1441875 RepID=A0ABV9EDA8_9ACTN|nr:TetR/AcrR family transcriptional regulator [Sphaerisporangium corydalis]
MARKPEPGARARILDIASRLFQDRGVRAVGLQQIIDECGCGKNLLYREFGSKDELVVAYLERCTREWAAIVGRAAGRFPGDPAAQLIAVVGGVAEQALTPGFRGCPLRNAHSEFPDAGHPVHAVVLAHYTGRQAHLRELARQAGAADPYALAERITLIIDGVNSNAPVLGGGGATPVAVALAEDVVKAATRPS